MNELEGKSLIFVCPYRGRIARKYVTTMKTCGKCVEEIRQAEIMFRERR